MAIYRPDTRAHTRAECTRPQQAPFFSDEEAIPGTVVNAANEESTAAMTETITGDTR